MLVNNNYQINFQGGFRFVAMPESAKNKLPNLINKGKQIFYDFENKGDVFFIVRDNADYKVLNFIKDNSLKFEYYPSISTRDRMDSEKPEQLTQLLKNNNIRIVTNYSAAKKSLKNLKKSEKFSEQEMKTTKKIMESLAIDVPSSTHMSSKKGAIVVDDVEFSRQVIITPPSKHGIHYVSVVPYSANQEVKRYAITSEGQILANYTTPDGIKTFKQNFNKLLIK